MGRPLFRLLTALHASLYRLTGGRFGGRIAGLRVLLLTTTGRRTGRKRTTPLAFFMDAGGYVITGSNGGSSRHAAWFHNLKSNPRAAIQVNDRQFEVHAEIAGPDRRDRLWARLIEIAPLYDRYATKTRREIPMVILRR